jgi:hypothetical protein
MCTQWRTGVGGAIGLDYAVLPAIMELVGVPQDNRLEVFNDLRLMEDAALAHLRKDSK